MIMGVVIQPFQSTTMCMQCRQKQKRGLEKSKIRLKDQSHALVWHVIPVPCKEEEEELVITWQTQTFLKRKQE